MYGNAIFKSNFSFKKLIESLGYGMVAESLAAQGEGPKFRSLKPTWNQTQFPAAVFPALLQREGRQRQKNAWKSMGQLARCVQQMMYS